MQYFQQKKNNFICKANAAFTILEYFYLFCIQSFLLPKNMFCCTFCSKHSDLYKKTHAPFLHKIYSEDSNTLMRSLLQCNVFQNKCQKLYFCLCCRSMLTLVLSYLGFCCKQETFDSKSFLVAKKWQDPVWTFFAFSREDRLNLHSLLQINYSKWPVKNWLKRAKYCSYIANNISGNF